MDFLLSAALQISVRLTVIRLEEDQEIQLLGLAKDQSCL